MALTAADIKVYKSLNTDSDGGDIDTGREITSPDGPNDLFPQISAAEALAGVTRYRKIFKQNTSGGDPWHNPTSYVKAFPSVDALSLGLGIAPDDNGARGVLAKMAATDYCYLESDGADTRAIHVDGRTFSDTQFQDDTTLTGTTPLASGTSYKMVYKVWVDSPDASRTITIRQGSGGPIIGTIPPNEIIAFLYMTGVDIDTYAGGLLHYDIGPSAYFSLWLRLVTPPHRAAANGVSFQVETDGTP